MEFTNPFEESGSEEEEAAELVLSEKPPVPLPAVNVDSIAEYLLKKQFILTALEFHTEILESGKELTRLKNYFSNPSHFEQVSPKELSNSGSLYRTSSCSTFDSLDLTRYSDDGAQQVDDRVAVLEFELRKAKETISSLRSNLTDAVEQNSFLKSQDVGEEEGVKGQDKWNGGYKQAEEAKPMEKRAVNYLINEYLLQNDYKLTSITLADENEDQDFEDWDDVGLNMPKPPNLLKLYRDYATLTTPNLPNNELEDVSKNPFEIRNESDLVQLLRDECEMLRKENNALASRISTSHQQAPEELETPSQILTSTPIKQATKEEGYASDPDTVVSDSTPVHHKNTQTDNKEIYSKEKSDNELIEAKVETCEKDKANCFPLPERMSKEYWNALSAVCKIDLDDESPLKKMRSMSTSMKELVAVSTESLPRIIPTVLLQKRENLIPLILSTAAMNTNPAERNKLLHELFNLIKKPDKIQRKMILSGCAAYAKHVGPSQTEEDLLPQCWEQIDHKYTERRYIVAEACGVLAAYMSPEMRGSLLLSILQQMQEEEKSPEVRQAIVRSYSLVFSLLRDDDKYSKAFEILFKFLQDPSLPVRETARQSLLPSIASWARHKGDLYTQVIDFVLTNLESITSKSKLSPNPDFDSDSFLESMEMLAIVLPHYFADLLLSMPSAPERTEEERPLPSRPPADLTAMLDPCLIIGKENYGSLLNCFDVSIASSQYDDWESLRICLDQVLPRLLKITCNLKPGDLDCVEAMSQLFRQFCILFGPVFLDVILKEQFQTLFMASNGDFHKRISLGETALTSSAVSVYASGVLTTFDTKERRSELSSFLKEMIQTISSCFAELDSIKSAFWGIKTSNPSYLPLLVEVLWGCVTNASSSIRSNAASIFAILISEDVDPKVLMTRIFPALITLSTDVNADVRTASIPALGAIVECPNVSRETVDQVITQMINFTLPYSSSVESPDGDRTEPSYHKLNLQLVITMGQVGPKAHPRFRDEFVLPHLAAIAAGNNQMSNATKRSDISLELLTAYSNISCCFIPENLLQSAFVPGLRCLLNDMEALSPEHVPAVNKLIREKEAKLQRSASQPVFSQSDRTIARSESKTKFYSKLF